jgi:uncharacterized membrane protein YjjP (DUF1212 family)
VLHVFAVVAFALLCVKPAKRILQTKRNNQTTKEMMKLVVFVVAAILASIHAELVRMEPSVNVFSSRFWLKERTVDEYASVRAVFALKHNRANMEELDHKLMDISNPNSQNYGKWMKVNFSFFCFPFFNFIVFPFVCSP